MLPLSLGSMSPFLVVMSVSVPLGTVEEEAALVVDVGVLAFPVVAWSPLASRLPLGS